MRFKRELLDRLGALAGQFPVVVVTGARQAGKTTLLREAFPHYTYVSLDLPSLAAQAEGEPRRFLESYPRPVLIDEVQYAPGLFRHIKRAVDEDRHSPGQFALTGSQKFTLMREVSDSLAGRAACWRQLPCDVQEIVDEHCVRCHSDPPKGTYMPLSPREHFHLPSTTDPSRTYYELAHELTGEWAGTDVYLAYAPRGDRGTRHHPGYPPRRAAGEPSGSAGRRWGIAQDRRRGRPSAARRH